MKNKLLTFAGLLVVLLVLAKIYEKPLLAQVRAALTQNVDEPGRHVFGYQNYGGVPTFTVPADRRYVIDQYSAQCFTTSTMTEVSIDVVAGGIPVEFATNSVHYIGSAGGVPPGNVYRATASGPIYADPGTTISLSTRGTSPISRDSCANFVTGHYVLLP
jgi:hypothetical protein